MSKGASTVRFQPIQIDCNESRLKSFLDDALPEPEHARLTRHLDECGSCRRRLEQLAAGSKIWNELRGLAAGSGEATPVETPLIRTTGAHPSDESADSGSTRLDFLAPSARPGSLGRLGAYEVTEVLGRGGFGIVLKAIDPALGRTVAIKVLAPELATSAAARSRFAREARAAAAVVHENVVAIHSVDSWNGLPYLVMPCITGCSLQERVDRDGPMVVKQVLRVGMQAALGLAAAHDQGLVHRDIKPSNILLENGVERVKLSDFGLARAVDDASQTQSGVIAGTPQYMSPEQARGETVDHRSDLFGLGSVLYFMCAGHAPFRADSTPAVLRRVCDDRPRSLRAVNAEVPAWLAEIVDRLMAKDPACRYSSAEEVAGILRSHLAELQRSGTSTSLRKSPQKKPTPARVRIRPSAVAAIVLAVAALAAAGYRGMVGLPFAPSAIGAQQVTTASRDESANSAIIGSGVPATKAWDIDDFSAVSIGSTFQAQITQGERYKITTSSDDNLIPFIKVVKEGKTLKIGLEPNKSYRPKTPLTAEVVLPVLDALETGGASRATLKGFRSDRNLKLSLGGASTIDGSIEAGGAEVRVGGASTLALSGSARVATVSAGGASRLKLGDFPLKVCAIVLEGASNATMNVQSERPCTAKLSGASKLDGSVAAAELVLEVDGASHAKIRGSAKEAKITADGGSNLEMGEYSLDARTLGLVASGASSVTLAGKADSSLLRASGGSQLRLTRLAVEQASVELSGASHATLDARKSLMYKLSSGSGLEYSGNPSSVMGSKSSGATLRKRP
jgi:serine/threonine-protein kinase